MQMYFEGMLHNYQWMQRGESFSDTYQAVKNKFCLEIPFYYVLYLGWEGESQL